MKTQLTNHLRETENLQGRATKHLKIPKFVQNINGKSVETMTSVNLNTHPDAKTYCVMENAASRRNASFTILQSVGIA